MSNQLPPLFLQVLHSYFWTAGNSVLSIFIWSVSVIKVYRSSFPYIQIGSTNLSYLENLISLVSGEIPIWIDFKKVNSQKSPKFYLEYKNI